MNINELKDQVNVKLQEFEAIKQQHLAGLKENLNTILSEVFANENIQAIAWSQYTPYFNDGDECVFRVSEPFIVLDGFEPDNIPGNIYEFDDDDVYVTYSNPSEHTLQWYKKYAEESGPDQDTYTRKYKSLLDMKSEYADVEPYCDVVTAILKEKELLRSM